jgi:hypothetical protein
MIRETAPSRTRTLLLTNGLFALICLTLVLLFLDGVFSTVQLILFDGRVPLPSYTLKVIAVVAYLAVIAARLLQTRRNNPGFVRMSFSEEMTGFTSMAILLAAYLALHAIVFTTAGWASYGTLAFGYNAYYAFLLLLPLAIWSKAGWTEQSLRRVFAIALLPLALLAYAQFMLQDPLIPTRSVDGSFSIGSWNFYGSVRAFSLLNGPGILGRSAQFMALLFLAYGVKRSGQRRWTAFFLALIAFGAVGVSVTRTAYLEALLSLSALSMLLFGRRIRRWIPYLPVGFAVCAALLLFVVPIVFSSGMTMISWDSLLQRIENWWYYGRIWLDGAPGVVLFGKGIVQHARAFPGVIIDSTPIALGLHTGLIGVLLAFVMYHGAWMAFCRKAQSSSSPVLLAVTAMWSTWIVSWSLNVVTAHFIILLLFVLHTSGVSRVPSPQTSHAGSVIRSTILDLRGFFSARFIAFALPGLAVFSIVTILVCFSFPGFQESMRFRFETRARMKALMTAERLFFSDHDRYTANLDSLLSTLKDRRRLPAGIDGAPLSLFWTPLRLDSLHHAPKSGQPYIIAVTPSGHRYQIRDPDNAGYISSWTNAAEFDRPSWE